LLEMEQVWNKVTTYNEICGVMHTPETMEWTKIVSLCKCLGGKNLAKILNRICRNPAHRSGIPDLIGTFS